MTNFTPLRAAIAAAFFAIPLLAQPSQTTIEIGAGGGRYFGGSFPARSSLLFPDGMIVDDGKMKGFWFEADFANHFGLQVAVRRTTVTVDAKAGGLFPHRPILATLDAASVETVLMRLFSHPPFVPYAGVGVGFSSLDINTDSPADQDSNRFAVSATVGAKFYAIRHAGVVLDIRKRATYLGARTDGTGSWRDRKLWFRDPELFAGVFFSR